MSYPLTEIIFKDTVRTSSDNLVSKPVPVAARSKAYFCDSSPAVIVGSNPMRDMDVCFECCQVEVPATG